MRDDGGGPASSGAGYPGRGNPDRDSAGMYDHADRTLFQACLLYTSELRTGVEKTAVFTFSVPPKAALSGNGLSVLTTNEERRALREREEIDYCVAVSYTHLDVYKRQVEKELVNTNAAKTGGSKYGEIESI